MVVLIDELLEVKPLGPNHVYIGEEPVAVTVKVAAVPPSLILTDKG